MIHRKQFLSSDIFVFHQNTEKTSFFHSLIIIVSKSLSETRMCPQMFIVKILIIKNMHSYHICMKRKEGARVQDSGETQREEE